MYSIFTYSDSQIPAAAIITALCLFAAILLAIGVAKASDNSKKALFAIFLAVSLVVGSIALLRTVELVFEYRLTVGLASGYKWIQGLA